MARTSTLWSPADLDGSVLEYTAGEDRIWDARLLGWDVLGSLGHIEGLRASRLITEPEYLRLRKGLRDLLSSVSQSRLQLDQRHEDVHTAVEYWLTSRVPGAGERLHTGRSRNDQVACDLRLFLKHELLQIQAVALELARALVEFAARHRQVLWPGYTHGRRAMPSSPSCARR